MRFRFPLIARLVLFLLAAAMLPLLGFSAAQWQRSKSNAEAILGDALQDRLPATAASVAGFLDQQRTILALVLALEARDQPLALVEDRPDWLAPGPYTLARFLVESSGESRELFVQAGLSNGPLAVELVRQAKEGSSPGVYGFVVLDRFLLRITAESEGRRATAIVDPRALQPMLEPFSASRAGEWFVPRLDSVLVTETSQVVAGEAGEWLTPSLIAATKDHGMAVGANLERNGESISFPVAGTTWRIVSWARVEPRPEVFGRSLLPALLLALALVLILSVTAFRELVRPIRRMFDRQATTHIPADPDHGVNELARSFDALLKSVEDREALVRTFLGRYEVLEVIAEGATGTVFKGWDPRLERPVALKTIRIDGAAEDRKAVADQLKREAVLTAKLIDSHIVTVYDVEQVESMAFIAMELVEGLSLEQRLRMGGPMSPSETVLVGAAVGRGLSAAHGSGILHRDVKSANVLIGDNHSIKMTDFGVRDAVQAGNERAAHFGTPGFFAPEAIEEDLYDERSDLFGLGCILFHCLVGEGPYAAKTVDVILRKTLEGNRGIEDRLAGLAGKELAGLIAQLLARDPNHRPSSAREVAKRLERFFPEDSSEWRVNLSIDV